MKALKSSSRFLVFAFICCLLTHSQMAFSYQGIIPKIIENSEKPKYSGRDAPELVFKQELSIPLVGRRYSFDVDDEGNIYLLESLAGRISVYDKEGNIVGQFGKKGQGPGEFENSVFLTVSKDKKIYVIDRSKKAIQIFDSQGKWLEQKRLPSLGMINSLKIDSTGFPYIQDTRNLLALQDKERIRRGVGWLGCLSKYDGKFEKIAEVDTWENAFIKLSGEGGANRVLYHDIFYYQTALDGSLYLGNSSSYEIRQHTSEGRVKTIIRKKTNRIPTTKKDRTNLMKYFPNLKEMDLDISKIKPFFFDFHVLDNIGLLVGTYENEWNEEGVLYCDLFDQDGLYIAKVKVPPYYYWVDQDNVSEQRNRLFKGGRCYSIVYNEKEETLELVRHSVELKWRNQSRPFRESRWSYPR